MLALVDEIDFDEFDNITDVFDSVEEEYVAKVNEEYLKQFPLMQEWKRFEPRTVVKYGLRYDEDRNRIVMPVYHPDGRVVGAQGRAVGQALPKYYNYENFQKGRTLFGLQVDKTDTIVLTEGPTDAMRVWEATGMSSAAMLGSDLTASQANILRSYSTVILALDNDKAGIKGTKKAVGLLVDDVDIMLAMFTLLPGEYSAGGMDPGSLPDEMIRKLINDAIDLA